MRLQSKAQRLRIDKCEEMNINMFIYLRSEEKPLDSLPPCAECFVRGANRQGEWFPLSEHLTGDVEVRAVLLVEA